MMKYKLARGNPWISLMQCLAQGVGVVNSSLFGPRSSWPATKKTQILCFTNSLHFGPQDFTTLRTLQLLRFQHSTPCPKHSLIVWISFTDF